MIRLPGRCGVCRAELVWNGKMWRNPRGTSRHVCPEDRPTCGAMMPNALERCARRPGHTTEHRTRYALDNARYNHGAVGRMTSVRKSSVPSCCT